MRNHAHVNTEGNGRPGREIEILSGSPLIQAWNTGSLIAEHEDANAEKVTSLPLEYGVWHF